MKQDTLQNLCKTKTQSTYLHLITIKIILFLKHFVKFTLSTKYQTYMNENLSEAILMLVIGMITVFIILGLVVLTGQVLIRITNRFAPDIKESPKGIGVIAPNNNNTLSKNNTINKKTMAAIIGTVEMITQGKGRIEKIEKI